MGVWIGRGSLTGLSLGLLWGEYDSDAMMREVARAYADGDIRAGEDRVVLLAPSFRSDTALVADLHRLQAEVAAREGAVFRSPGLAVFVVAGERTLPPAAIYAAIWELQSRGVRPMRIVESFAEAAECLNSPDLVADLEEVMTWHPTSAGDHPTRP